MEPEDQRRIHKGSPINPILSQTNPIPRTDNHLFKIHCNISYLGLGIPRGFLLLDLSLKIMKALLSSFLATCLAHLNLLDLIIL
jgi:hypothetical protein